MMLNTPKYAQAMRVIGQTLEQLHLLAFNIKSEGKDYVIQGYAEACEPVEFRYAEPEIEQLDQEGRQKRRDPSGMPDFRGLSQILRAIGDYLEHKEARLVGVAKRQGTVPMFLVQYQTGQQPAKEEQYLASDLYDFALHMYKQRRAPSTV